jgi:HEAT repeat protein
MWKVKKASLYTLGQLGSRTANEALPYLIKLLKESPINKQTIAETIVKLGLEGESVLLKLMAQESDANYKLKAAIVRAFAFADINSTNIDFIIECVFRQGKNSNSLVRKAAIFAVKVLCEKAEEKSTYLKKKNVIPFYYDKLKDKESTIQQYAINCIKALGPQGELIFIEGLVNDPNPVIRANCAIGLGEIGVHTIRTLLVGLHDEEEGVRTTVEKVIVTQMNIADVVNYFAENEGGQLSSLKIAIKDLIENNYPLSMFAKNYLNQLIEEIEKVK